ncbi:PorP/SprF family type IX secretion system membrane protein [Flavisolibacter ginsenosidimutans]|uniref:Type IX secretion system membrane protein PorP/SprF n=1 Tax=Flavisolibacter ginsenosidimutans TaxID=661481 RepID=A0A5B8UN90_9BACT|nr:PorP/SprF family type IX secretion system membrane protein [Flavisolibacter ginsenosidimutans]QEC57550.1 type IX secretion system membrane protein PorP/SprF [Flavisolibacter ginsenosidimutans]
MKRAFFFLLSSVITLLSSAQDINFSQFYELPLLRNPALSGLFTGDLRITSAFRNQWGSVTVPYRTQALGAELKFRLSDVNYMALGLQVTNDVAGDSKLGKTAILPALTFHISLNGDKDTYISAGFMGGPVQQRFDASKLSFDDQFVNGSYSATNPTRQVFTNTNLTYYDLSAGLLFSSVFGDGAKYYAGGSMFHVFQPLVAFSGAKDVKLNRKYMINAGLSAPTSDADKVIVYADGFSQGGSTQTQGGLMFKHDVLQEDEDYGVSLSAGAFVRWNDAVMPLIKLDYYKLGIGMTYDVNVSKLRSASSARGGFELTASYKTFLSIRNSSAAAVRCPVAF